MSNYPSVVCILAGGDIYTIQETPYSKRYVFEWHPMWGPSKCRRDNGEICKHPFFPQNSPFWPLFERWRVGGMQVDAHGRCILPNVVASAGRVGERPA